MLESLELLSKLKLTSVELRTLLFLCSKIGTDDNIIYIKQTTISKELNLDKSNLSKAIKNLKQLGLIVKVTNGYMINPNLIYKGKKEMKKIREMHQFFEEKMDYDPDKTLEFGFYQKIR
ncbi:helix-turn-helix domain-containing protein [Staphylococcus epidermidis]|nr:helix-turn-helix domain-containing protein [Staphylococcus epidermidis]